MCLAVPLEVVEILDGARAMVRQGDGDALMEVDVSLLDGPRVGAFVLVHAGFAIETVNLEEAHRTIAMLRELGSVDAAG